ncbi:23S rRNA (adenine(2030)-N(6))-methyltransferase RlmJ [Cardiobacteriaceae bacterium TAE3-ERU3]|nr:23S rRNA (adenine(2030)-N(6))-methyltransferase RlmJ [Cardiobacteriaceae bacterium TAE3-ERU3]
MLSYRHAFHAGNHADLLKHLVLIKVLEYYNRKDKPYIYIDTHAGAGSYDLEGDYAQKTAEHRAAIGVLRATMDQLSEPLQDFLESINQCTGGDDHLYPGSPVIASTLMRKKDYIRLCELHPTDVKILELTMAHLKSNVRYSISHQDGLKAALGWLPPPNRRAVVLTDPSYEVKSDYDHAPDAFLTMHQRCREACLMLWYPLLPRRSVFEMRDRLKTIFADKYLSAELTVQAANEHGMYGSGMFIVNPPYILKDQLNDVLPNLVSLLAQDSSANYKIEQA